jgi:hypothetical protein
MMPKNVMLFLGSDQQEGTKGVSLLDLSASAYPFIKDIWRRVRVRRA